MSTVDGFRLALRRFTISPALEKILSDGTDVAGIPKYFTASVTSCGYLAVPFVLHQSSGFVLTSGVTSCVNSRIGSTCCCGRAFWTDDSSSSAALGVSRGLLAADGLSLTETRNKIVRKII